MGAGKKEEQEIELRSEEVQEILGHIPSRIIRYGISVIVTILILLVLGSCFFKYPDILIAQAEIITKNPPADIVAKSSGELTHLLVADTQLVIEGEVLAVIQNAANYKDVKTLNLLLEQVTPNNVNPFQEFFEQGTYGQLGELQVPFSDFQQSYFKLQNFITLDVNHKKIQALKSKRGKLKSYGEVLLKQWKLKDKGYEFSEQQYERDSMLFVRDVISQADFERAKQKLYTDKMEVYDSHVIWINKQIEFDELTQQILEQEQTFIEIQDAMQRKVKENYSLLKSKIAWWFDAFLLQSPIEGRVVFNEVWSSFQYVTVGQQVFTVIPSQKQEKISKVRLPIKGAGKVKIGQTVNLKFEQYPYQEFGMITTRVDKISLVQSESFFMLELALPDNLITNYGIQLPFNQKMQATAEIITEDLPLIARIFNPLKAMFKERLRS